MRALLLPFLLTSTAAVAQADQREIVVTGRGLQPAAGEEVFDTVILDRSRLQTSASNRLEDLLRDVPGFQLFRRSDARSANPTSQGATLRALGGNASSRALLILDGVPQTDPFGGWVSWPAYDPQRLGEVRVTRGGGSGAYGPGALAGTIELSSADPIEGLTADVAYGSRDSVDAHAGLGLAAGGGFVTVAGAYARGDGFVPIVREDRGAVDRPAPYEQAGLAVRAVAPLGNEVELQASGLVFRDERERGTLYSGILTKGADASLRLVGRRWTALAYLQTRDFTNSFASVAAGRNAVSQASEQYSVPSTGLGARGEWRPEIGAIDLRLGADWRATIGETRELYSFVAGAGTRGRVAGGRTDTVGGFAEASWRTDALTLTAGGRIDRWWITNGVLGERVLATGQQLTDTDFADRSGWEPTGRAGIAFRPGAGITLRSAGYLGWRLPTLNELYRPFRAGTDATAANAELDPERLKGVEAGIDWEPAKRVRIGATLFANRLDDAIANVTLGRGPGTFSGVGFVAAGGEYRQRQNLESITARGLEVDASARLGAWSLAGGWSWVHARVEADGSAAPLDGLRPAQTPKHMLSATLGWDGGAGRNASLAARWVSRQYEDDLNSQSLRGAFTLDAAAAWPLTRHLSLQARAENLTDARVEAAISSDGIVERATPRTLWIGLRLR
ncbi:TonB-dependent receptor [Sphingosinicella sp. BN140058]|uniref:TonB-dependent receptor n=1 Tax=Sphingosinicella sp. BN140058 TaxID=1892855 RepID=UPI00101288D1|nr:TonB-dependent receptor [Sphingosinicella sp. BN140058]QAY76142.1 TonB-dependent receptor [Sphingosinicella sp. BN140058]